MKHAKCENREQYVHNVLALAMIRLCRHVIGRAEVMRQHCLSNTKVKEAEWTWLYRCLRGNGREVQRGIIVDLRPPGIGNGRVLNETDLPQDGQSVLGKAVDGHESPDVTASKHEQARSLRERLQRLPEQERMVIMLSYYEEHSDEEVSKITGLPVADVKVILRRAIRLLRADAS